MSTQGAFVLLGAPLDPTQFEVERWYMQQLHEQTQATVPWPYLLEYNADVFFQGEDLCHHPLFRCHLSG